MVGSSAKIVKRQSKSCGRCLKRKQRCHGFPICTGCEEAGVPCEQSEYALQLHSRDSSYAGFKRIQELETQLGSALSQLAAFQQGQGSLDLANEMILGDQMQPVVDQVELPLPWKFNDPGSSFENAAYYSRAPNEAILPSTVEATSASFSLSAALGDDGVPFTPRTEADCSADSSANRAYYDRQSDHIAHASIWSRAVSPLRDNIFASAGKPGDQGQGIPPPADATGRRLLELYFEKIYPRYPFLERSELFQLHFQRHNPDHSTRAARFNTYKLYMVYAIGALLLKNIDPDSESAAGSFFERACQYISDCVHSDSLQSIEALLLLALYGIRSPARCNTWYTIGLAMRTCIDLELHVESSYVNEPPMKSWKRRRLFWTVYLLERFISLSLKRPFSIAEHDIETRLPMVEEESNMNAEGKTNTSLIMWVRLIQIKRFESQIHSEVYRSMETRKQRLAKVGPILASLDAWQQTEPPSLPKSETSYLRLQWNEAVSRLLRPFLGMLQRDNLIVSRCLSSCGQICSIYKEMHQRGSYSHSFISAHAVFIAGVTMCYCLLLAPELFNNTVANSLRACSSTMFVIAERSPSLRKHRDILEDIIDRIIDSPTSANLGHSGVNSLSKQNCSEVDYLAVQSLLNLSAQQEPHGIVRPGKEQQTRVE